MYDKETGTPAQAQTSNLNEELGQVDTILSDKTGNFDLQSYGISYVFHNWNCIWHLF